MSYTLSDRSWAWRIVDQRGVFESSPMDGTEMTFCSLPGTSVVGMGYSPDVAASDAVTELLDQLEAIHSDAERGGCRSRQWGDVLEWEREARAGHASSVAGLMSA